MSSGFMRRSLVKVIQSPPLNFILDSFDPEYICFVHESSGILLYLFDTFLIWKENRLADSNITPHVELEDLSSLCENVFTKLKAYLLSLELLEQMINRAIVNSILKKEGKPVEVNTLLTCSELEILKKESSSESTGFMREGSMNEHFLTLCREESQNATAVYN